MTDSPKVCKICSSEMERDGYDESGYWKVYSCTNCGGEVLEKIVNETDGPSVKDLSNIHSFKNGDEEESESK